MNLDLRTVAALTTNVSDTPILLYQNETGAAQVIYIDVTNTTTDVEVYFSTQAVGKPTATTALAIWDQDAGFEGHESVMVVLDIDEDLYLWKEGGVGFVNINVVALTDPVNTKVLFKGSAPAARQFITGLDTQIINRIYLTATSDIVSTRFLMPYFNGDQMADLEVKPNEYFLAVQYYIYGGDTFEIESFNNEIDYAVRVCLIPQGLPIRTEFLEVF